MSRYSIIVRSIIISMILLPGVAKPDLGDSDKKQSPLNAAYELIENAQYEEAIDLLGATNLEVDSKDADVLNLLAYSHRKLAKYEQALNFYKQALSLEPEHKAANEYLGELYLQTGDLALAKERLAVLDDACFFSCDEYDDLKQAIEAYEEKTSN